MEAAEGVTDATPVRLNFTAIAKQVAEILGVTPESVTDAMIGDLLGHDRSTIWRWRGGSLPTLPVAIATAQKLGLSVDELTGAGD